LGGAYAVEALTGELEERARELVERIDELGGAVAAVEQGFVQQEIEEAAFRFARDVERGERVVVGVNRYVDDGEAEVELQRIDPDIERRQLERTARVRVERDQEAARRALADVRSVAEGTGNLLVPMREALRARSTIGEICGELRSVFGTYDKQRPAT
jgi:methylmalonyl-CoA mutase N-terminal domain/subunit